MGKSKFIIALALAAKPENKASVDAGNFFDKLKKIPLHIRKTNANISLFFCGLTCLFVCQVCLWLGRWIFGFIE